MASLRASRNQKNKEEGLEPGWFHGIFDNMGGWQYKELYILDRWRRRVFMCYLLIIHHVVSDMGTLWGIFPMILGSDFRKICTRQIKRVWLDRFQSGVFSLFRKHQHRGRWFGIFWRDRVSPMIIAYSSQTTNTWTMSTKAPRLTMFIMFFSTIVELSFVWNACTGEKSRVGNFCRFVQSSDNVLLSLYECSVCVGS